MDMFATTSVPMPTSDLAVDMFASTQWLNTLPLTSSFSAGCQQPPSPLQLSSPCTPSGSNSLSSGFASTPGSYPAIDPYYNPTMQENYQQMFDDYSSTTPCQPISPFFHSGLSPEANIGRFLAAFSNCLQQAADKDFSACQEMWERFVCEFFDNNVLFCVETIGGSEKQRYVLSREHIPGYFHTYAEAGMNSIQYALGEGHLTRHEEVLRMDYGNATCLMDCVKPNLVKMVREGRLLVDMKTEDNLKMTFWYFKINKYNEFILRDALATKEEQKSSSCNLSSSLSCGLPPAANAYLKKHGQAKVNHLDELLLSPICNSGTPTFVAPDNNWLLGTDPFSAYNGTHTTYSDMQSKMLTFPPYQSDHDQPTNHFMPPKNPITSRHSSWSASSSKNHHQHSNKFKKQHKLSTDPKGKKRRRPVHIYMYTVEQPLTLHRDGRLLKGITDTQERKIACIKNTFETLRNDQEPLRLNSTSKNSRIGKPILKLNTTLSKTASSFQNTLLSSSTTWTDTLKFLNNNDIKIDQRQLCA